MDFYDYNIVSIGHTSLDSDWIIRDAYWDGLKSYGEKIWRINTEKSLSEMVEIYKNDRKIPNKDYYMKSREPWIEETDLHFFFWHVFTFSPLNNLPIDTEFHVRKYKCAKNVNMLSILKENVKTCNIFDYLYYTTDGASLDELQLVSQYAIPCPVKQCDLPKEHLSEIDELMSRKISQEKCYKLQETDSCVPFSGKVARAYYLSEFISRCENLINSKSREKQPEENPHVSMRKKQK